MPGKRQRVRAPGGKVYETITAAAEAEGVQRQTIRERCLSTTARTQGWRFIGGRTAANVVYQERGKRAPTGGPRLVDPEAVLAGFRYG